MSEILVLKGSKTFSGAIETEPWQELGKKTSSLKVVAIQIDVVHMFIISICDYYFHHISKSTVLINLSSPVHFRKLF